MAPINHSKYNESILAYNIAIELDPQNVGALVGKSNVLISLAARTKNDSLYEIAEEYINSALEIDPRNPWTWGAKGSLLVSQNKYDEALNAYDKALELNPQDKSIWLVKGQILANNMGRFSESIEAYDRFLQIDPNVAYAWKAKGDALKALDHSSEADAAYAKAKALGYKELNG
jgi:tetratricopeptide (TPR) repeat protein